MPVNHHAVERTPGANSAESGIADTAAIHVQLDRLLISPHLRNSRRCQALLKYVVEAYLDGSPDKAKERCIGFEVFQREPDYDTSQDSIVRTTAAEVRKRLAQYYLEPEHQHEIRFTIPHGSYCPEIRFPAPTPAPDPVLVAPDTAVRHSWLSRRGALGACAGLAVAIGLATVYGNTRPTAFDRFWKPLLDDPSSAVICIEQPLRIYRFTGPNAGDLNRKMVGGGVALPGEENPSLRLADLEPAGAHYFTYGDLISASRLSDLLGRKSKSFQVLGDRDTAYRDLRGRPAILLGEFNNQWIRGLTSGLRYYLDKNEPEQRYEIRDRQAPGKVMASVPKGQRPAEYSIVSRIVDISTEKTVITVVGTTYFGTMAGSDFLTHAPYMNEAFHDAPANWYRKNIQVVLTSPVVGGAPGPPRVMALHFW